MIDQGPRTPRGIYDGFEAYRTPTETDYQQAMTAGLVVPDTNVLLNLYRYNPTARQDLFAVLTSLRDRLWIPHQVVVEFWRNREAALLEPKDFAEHTVEALEELCSKAIGEIRKWSNRTALPTDRVTPITDQVTECFNEATEQIKAIAAESLSATMMSAVRNTNQDEILLRLQELANGRVGPPLSPTDYEIALREAQRRIEAKIPPGYKDKSKLEERAAGDYIIWEEIMIESKGHETVLLISGDGKDDWWRMERGEARGPRAELVSELRHRTGARLLMLRPESLLIHARSFLAVEFQENSLEDIVRVERSLATRDIKDWTVDSLSELMRRLEQEAPVQAEVLKRASRTKSIVSRQDVYAIGGYDEDRTLRGFTRPIRRVCRQLRDEGILSEEALDPIEVHYASDRWSQALGFGIPRSLTDIFTGLDPQS